MSVTVITGGAGGIARACAERLRERGPVLTADIAGADVVCDVTDAASVAALAERAAELGPLGALVHTAGLAPPGKHDPRRVLEVNLAGTARVLDAFLPHAGPETVAVCIASLAGHRAFAAECDERFDDPLDPTLYDRLPTRDDVLVTYSLSKRGVMLEVRKRAAEWGARGARIVSVSPGLVVDTAIGQAAATIHAGAYAELSALGRAGVAADIAGVVAFLSSPDAAYVTGCDVLVDGGVVAHTLQHADPDARRKWNAATYDGPNGCLNATVLTMETVALETLFEPVQLGPLTLRNRLVMAPMGTCLDESGHITDETIAYYVRRAAGGVGTITVEGCLVSAETVGPEPKICGPEYLPGLKKLVTALKAYDVTVGVQLMHPGRQVVAGPTVAPSPVPLNSHAPIPHELTVEEIGDIIADYAQAADYAAEAGFEFVEVHGAHGYLPSNFLSPLDNQRTDAYGGSLENRARFCLEVAKAIDSLPLVWRINGEDSVPGGFSLEECVQVSRWLEEAGCVAISVSAGTWHTLHVTLAPMFVPRGHMRHFAAAVKEAVNIPVIAVGRLDDPALAAEVIESGDADLVLLGRTLIAEPDWPRKVEEGRLNEVRPCIACNACVDLVGRGEVARCSVNPEAGRELTWKVTQAEKARRVMVVGSGPAGMEAARIARLRGHDVSIWERENRLGGKLEVAGLAPSKREVLRFRDFQARRLAELGVEIHLEAEVTPALVEEQAPDVVLVATGAEPMIPPIPGIGSAIVHDAQRFLRDELEPGERVVIVGGSATGCETAEHLIGKGVDVTIVEMRKGVGFGIEAITRRHLVKELKRSGVKILTGAKVVMIENDTVLYEDDEGTHSLPVDQVALAIGWRPVGNKLAEHLECEVVVLGDASRPADFVAAINAGADAGLAL